MSHIRHPFWDQSNFKNVAHVLINKPRKHGAPLLVKARKAWAMYEYYAKNNYSIDVQIKEIKNAIRYLNDKKKLSTDEHALLDTAEKTLSCLTKQIISAAEHEDIDLFIKKQKIAKINQEYLIEKKKQNPSLNNLIRINNKIITEIHTFEYPTPSVINLLNALYKERDKLYFHKAKQYMTEFNRYNTAAEKSEKIDLLIHEIEALEQVINKSDPLKQYYEERKSLYYQLTGEQKLKEIEKEIVNLELNIIDRQRQGKSIVEQLATIAELNESMSAIYESQMEYEKQLNVLLTAKTCLLQIPTLNTDQRDLLEEIENTIFDAKLALGMSIGETIDEFDQDLENIDNNEAMKPAFR